MKRGSAAALLGLLIREDAIRFDRGNKPWESGIQVPKDRRRKVKSARKQGAKARSKRR